MRGTMFCTQCGNSLNANVRFCTKCGKPVAEAPAQPVDAAPARPVAQAPALPASEAEQQDPFKPAGMSHADYAYQGLPASSASSKSTGSKRGLAIGLIAAGVVLFGIVGISLATSAGNNNTATQDSSTSQDDSTYATEDNSTSGGLSEPDNSGFGSPSWVPAGFTQVDQNIFDYDMAYKFVTDSYNSEDIDCTGCSYWVLQAVSEAFCPGGAYAEIDILDDAGVKIDFTNDVVNYVGYGETVTFILKSYEDAAATAEVTELNCYEQ